MTENSPEIPTALNFTLTFVSTTVDRMFRGSVLDVSEIFSHPNCSENPINTCTPQGQNTLKKAHVSSLGNHPDESTTTRLKISVQIFGLEIARNHKFVWKKKWTARQRSDQQHVLFGKSPPRVHNHPSKKMFSSETNQVYQCRKPMSKTCQNPQNPWHPPKNGQLANDLMNLLLATDI